MDLTKQSPKQAPISDDIRQPIPVTPPATTSVMPLDQSSAQSKSPQVQVVQIQPKESKSFQILRKIGYEVDTELGRGAYARVVKARRNSDGLMCAIKIVSLRPQGMEHESFIQKFLPREVAILHSLNHRNILKLHDALQCKQFQMYLITELAQHGTLLEFVESQILSSHMPEPLAKALFRQLTDAVLYLNTKGICHRDIKPENILLSDPTFEVPGIGTQAMTVKLCDFGFARKFKESTTSAFGHDNSKTFCGTKVYAAPEVLLNQTYDPTKVDVWSMGIVLYFMNTGRVPFAEQDLISQIPSHFRNLRARFSPGFFKRVSPHLIDILRRMIEPQSFVRATVSQVSEHAWLTDAVVWKADAH